MAAATAEKRGYADFDPERCWEHWQVVRAQARRLTRRTASRRRRADKTIRPSARPRMNRDAWFHRWRTGGVTSSGTAAGPAIRRAPLVRRQQVSSEAIAAESLASTRELPQDA
jgi:hypothetical protein